jgi:hypothetical protein
MTSTSGLLHASAKLGAVVLLLSSAACIVLTQTSVTLRTGASINGRLLAQTAVNIDGSTVVEPPR